MTLALVCTNDTRFCEAVKITLEQAGYSVVFQSGYPSGSAFPRDAFGVVLIDLDGKANLIEAIVTAREQHPDAPTLYLTPFPIHQSSLARNEISLEKPFSLKELLSSLEKLLNRTHLSVRT